jgi:uncharacterized protein YndB with AHSA1/START domain
MSLAVEMLRFDEVSGRPVDCAHEPVPAGREIDVLKIGLYVVLGLGGLVAVVALIGAALPKGHRASKTTSFAATSEEVFAVISDVARYAEWRPDVKRVELLPDENGRRMFKEHGGNGAVTYRIEQSQPPSRLLIRIADPSLPFGGTWTHELKATSAGGTELTTIEDGEVYNPIFRFMSRFFFSPTKTIETFHSNLSKKLTRREGHETVGSRSITDA